jgi:hypothetical protein
MLQPDNLRLGIGYWVLGIRDWVGRRVFFYIFTTYQPPAPSHPSGTLGEPLRGTPVTHGEPLRWTGFPKTALAPQPPAPQHLT